MIFHYIATDQCLAWKAARLSMRDRGCNTLLEMDPQGGKEALGMSWTMNLSTASNGERENLMISQLLVRDEALLVACLTFIIQSHRMRLTEASSIVVCP